MKRSWELLAEDANGVGGKLTSLGGGGGDNGGVLHGTCLLKGLDELGNGRTLLADGDVDAVELLGLVRGTLVPALLVQHSVESDGGLASLTITDDQLTLTTTDRHHGVDSLETSLHRLVDGTTGQNAGGFELSTTLLLGLDRALAVDGLTEGVDDTAEQLRPNWDIDLFSWSANVAAHSTS